MAGGDDFYSRDRPDHPQLPEDRPRGGGPEHVPRGGHRKVLLLWLLAAAVILILFFIFI
ncbi:hypothetical protein [Streptomyces sp. NK08204]|uniref:hypothetical protein n=1 Tax=Streptomyces sp. NK08204 TaxID=2873260 RepID=UPI001CEC37EE|nr:hypothetical protein [Streptomyces sp. NK08204]